VTPQVFQFIGPSNDGRRHGRGTYLFIIVIVQCKTKYRQSVAPDFTSGEFSILINCLPSHCFIIIVTVQCKTKYNKTIYLCPTNHLSKPVLYSHVSEGYLQKQTQLTTYRLSSRYPKNCCALSLIPFLCFNQVRCSRHLV
jgi:hypothetical protein